MWSGGSMRISECPLVRVVGDDQTWLQFFVLILCCGIFCYGCMLVFAVLYLVFLVLNQDIGREERLRNDLFCVGWDGRKKLQLNHSDNQSSSCCSCTKTSFSWLDWHIFLPLLLLPAWLPAKDEARIPKCVLFKCGVGTRRDRLVQSVSDVLRRNPLTLSSSSRRRSTIPPIVVVNIYRLEKPIVETLYGAQKRCSRDRL